MIGSTETGIKCWLHLLSFHNTWKKTKMASTHSHKKLWKLDPRSHNIWKVFELKVRKNHLHCFAFLPNCYCWQKIQKKSSGFKTKYEIHHVEIYLRIKYRSSWKVPRSKEQLENGCPAKVKQLSSQLSLITHCRSRSYQMK